MKSPAPQELLTVDEAAELLRMSKPAVYAAVERGTLPGAVRLGRRIRFSAAVLRKHMGLTTVRPPPYSDAPVGAGPEGTP
jgi:excisionase family DNA binding protein